ncbi:MAG: CoA-binding protein [Fibrobacter sp.]|nr:CoA-binding protein [Fibrobacter sp.]
MPKVSRNFFQGKEILFLGYSGKNESFCKMILEAMSNNGFKVYPVNNNQSRKFDNKVYNNISELPSIPENVYIMMNIDNTVKAIADLKNKGVKRILFQNKKVVNESLLEQCRQMGIDTAIACPMMMFGKGLHRFHGFLAGVR